MPPSKTRKNNIEIIGKGVFGCVVKPALQCSKTRRQNLVSKLYTAISSKKFLPEFVISEAIIKRCGAKAHDYFVLPIANCKLTEDQKKLPIVEKCKQYIKFGDSLDSFLQIPAAEGDLDHYLKNITDFDVPVILDNLRNLIIGLKLIHSHNIVHDDIKPDNILYGHDSTGKLWFKFTDYGLGKIDTPKTYIYRQDVKRLANVINKFLKKLNKKILNNDDLNESFNTTNTIRTSWDPKRIYIHSQKLNTADELLAEFDTLTGQNGGAINFFPAKYFRGLSATKTQKRKKEIRRFGSLHWKNPEAYKGFETDKGVKKRTSSYTQRFRKMFPKAKSLKQKSEATGVPLKYITESYNRGMAAWRTGHRPGATEQQWGYARAHSMLLCGKTHYTTDSDIVRRAKKASAKARKWFKKCKTTKLTSIN